MLLRVQSAILDFLAVAGLRDNDGFAADAALAYSTHRGVGTEESTVRRLLRIRTSTFAIRRGERRHLTTDLVQRLDRKFDLASLAVSPALSPRGGKRAQVIVLAEGARTRRGDVAFGQLLESFKAAVESDGLDGFWKSRVRSELRPRPEQIAQLSLMMFLKEPLRALSGFALREVRSGIGFIDVMAVFGKSKRYVVELKMRSGARLTGPAQLARYLKTAGLSHGYLVVFDSRKLGNKVPKTPVVIDGCKLIIVSIDINPIAPSAHSR